MAKQSNNGHQNGDEESVYSVPEVFITSKGIKIKFIGLNPARLEKLQTAGTMPPVPVRMIPNDLGDPQKEELSEKDLQNDEERSQWKEYTDKKEFIERKRNENVLKYVFNDGFSVDVVDIETWKQLEEEEYGIEISTSPVQLKMDYINANVIGNAEDLGNIMAGVLERTGVPADMLDDIRNTFRSQVRKDTTPETPTE